MDWAFAASLVVSGIVVTQLLLLEQQTRQLAAQVAVLTLVVHGVKDTLDALNTELHA